MACVRAHNFSHGALGALALLVDFWIDVERERVVTVAGNDSGAAVMATHDPYNHLSYVSLE
jgi:hypothetical protein